MDFKIVDVYVSSGQLVVTAEHYNASGSLWFVEHYTWQGREGSKQKRATNALGEPLLDDGVAVPPTVRAGGRPDQLEHVLPAGRQWALRPGPHMVDASILDAIRSVHRQRLASGWPQGKVDRLTTPKPSQADNAGCQALLTRFQHLKDWME